MRLIPAIVCAALLFARTSAGDTHVDLSGGYEQYDNGKFLQTVAIDWMLDLTDADHSAILWFDVSTSLQGKWKVIKGTGKLGFSANFTKSFQAYFDFLAPQLNAKAKALKLNKSFLLFNGATGALLEKYSTNTGGVKTNVVVKGFYVGTS